MSEKADRVLGTAHQPGRRGSGTPGSPCLRALSTKLEFFFLGPGSWKLGCSAGQREGAVQIQSPSWGALRVQLSCTKPAPKILINEVHNPVHP